MYKGTGIAIVTPFNSKGEIEYSSLENHINFLIDGKVEYLVVLGTTGESPVLSKVEKQDIFEFCSKTVNGRIPLVAGISGNHTAEVVIEAKNFNIKGYTAILSASPGYNKPTQEGIYQHYKGISEASNLPIILYNVPGRTSSNISAETTLRLARDFKNIVAIKEASGMLEQVMAILSQKPEKFSVISGEDALTLPMIACGADGVISVVGNAFPYEFSECVRLALKGEFKEAKVIHYRLLKFIDLLFAEGNPGGVKAALKVLGVMDENMRLPLVPISNQLRAQIKVEVSKIKSA